MDPQRSSLISKWCNSFSQPEREQPQPRYYRKLKTLSELNAEHEEKMLLERRNSIHGIPAEPRRAISKWKYVEMYPKVQGEKRRSSNPFDGLPTDLTALPIIREPDNMDDELERRRFVHRKLTGFVLEDDEDEEDFVNEENSTIDECIPDGTESTSNFDPYEMILRVHHDDDDELSISYLDKKRSSSKQREAFKISVVEDVIVPQRVAKEEYIRKSKNFIPGGLEENDMRLPSFGAGSFGFGSIKEGLKYSPPLEEAFGTCNNENNCDFNSENAVIRSRITPYECGNKSTDYISVGYKKEVLKSECAEGTPTTYKSSSFADYEQLSSAISRKSEQQPSKNHFEYNGVNSTKEPQSLRLSEAEIRKMHYPTQVKKTKSKMEPVVVSGPLRSIYDFDKPRGIQKGHQPSNPIHPKQCFDRMEGAFQCPDDYD